MVSETADVEFVCITSTNPAKLLPKYYTAWANFIVTVAS